MAQFNSRDPTVKGLTMILNSLRHGYTNLLNFSGRDARGQFWPFAVIHVAALVLLWIPFFIIEIMGSIAKMRQFAEANPDKATVIDEPGHYSITIHEPVPGLGPDTDLLLLPLFVLGLALIALLAAAVTRRLHDTGRRGWIGLIPATLFMIALLVMRELFSSVSERSDQDFSLFLTGFGLNLAYNIAMIVLIVLLCLRSQPLENRFGKPPEIRA